MLQLHSFQLYAIRRHRNQIFPDPLQIDYYSIIHLNFDAGKNEKKIKLKMNSPLESWLMFHSMALKSHLRNDPIEFECHS